MKKSNLGLLVIVVALQLFILWLFSHKNTQEQVVTTSTALVDCMKFTGNEEPLDGKLFLYDATYEKSWELENCGSFTWDGYSLERLGWIGQNTKTPHTVPVPNLSPGQRGQVKMQVTTSTSPGHSRVYFMLTIPDESRHKFGDLLWLDHEVVRLKSD